MPKSIIDVKECERKMEELKRELLELQERAYEERSRRDEYNLKAREISAKIREVRSLIQEKRQELLELINERRKLIDEAREIKGNIRLLKEQISNLRLAKREYISRLRIIQHLLGRKIIDEEKLKEELEKLEWEYQTTPLPLEIEKIYVKKIDLLEYKLQLLRARKKLSSKIDEVNNEIVSRVREIEKLKEKLSELSNNIDELTKKIGDLKANLEELRNRLNNLLRERDECRNLANKHHNNYVNLVNRINEVKDEIQRLNLLLKATKIAKTLEEQREILRKKAEKIYEKYKRGEKLSLEEFKLLLEFGYIGVSK